MGTVLRSVVCLSQLAPHRRTGEALKNSEAGRFSRPAPRGVGGGSLLARLGEAGETIGYAFVLKSKGYNFITMAVGVDSRGKVTGIKVVTNEETPGLGAVAAENPRFLGQFEGMGPDPLTLGENVDGVSSATYTSRGITNGVNMALDVWRYLSERG